MKYILAVALCLIVFNVSASTLIAFEPTECRFTTTITDVACGDLLVPEDYTVNDSPTIRVHVAIIRARQETPQPDPILYLSGGPGGHMLRSLDSMQAFSDLYQSRDLVVLDQRGVGTSQPALDCPEISTYAEDTASSTAPQAEQLQAYRDAVKACRDRLVAEGVTLSAYNTDFIAHDIEQLRKALGYEHWNLFGTSYGTSLIQTVIRDYPNSIRSVILDSPLSLDSDWVLNASMLAESAFERWFTSCANANNECSNLEAILFDLVDQWNETPQAIEGNFYGTPFEVVIDGNEMLHNVYSSLYYPQSLTDLPQAIQQASEGDYENIGVYDLYQTWNTYGFSFGMNFSVLCADVANQEPVSEDNSRFDASFGVGSVLHVCNIWDVSPRLNRTPLTNSDIPALLLYGEFDPVLTEDRVSHIADIFDNGYAFELPSLSHIVSFSDACPRQIMQDFLNNPTGEPDSDCIDRIQPLNFRLN